MISDIYLFIFIIPFFGTINALPYYRYRRQINSLKTDGFFYEGRKALVNTPSGSIPGTYYYGIGTDPNYGSHIRVPNSAHSGGIIPISYNPSSNLFSQLINPDHQHPQQNYWYNNNNNAWQSPNMNNHYNQFGNRYPPGSQGWYATGGNFWYNNGQSVIAYPCLLVISILMLIICK